MLLPNKVVGVAVMLAIASAGVGACSLSSWAAGGLLHPARHATSREAPVGCEDATYSGDRVELQAWRCPASGTRRGTVVYLHGIADNRSSAVGAIDRFSRRGFDVIAYDSRAHGASGGQICTYGYYEKIDLQRVLDTISNRAILLIGSSLGAAVALQAAAEDGRISAVVAAETFSDLRTVATERAPWFLTAGTIRKAFAEAERRGDFKVDAASPVAAAARISVPVLLIHGADDKETPNQHSRRVYDALRGPKRLILVEGAGHNQSLNDSVWREVEDWLDQIVGVRS